jgi:hypothetical protein
MVKPKAKADDVSVVNVAETNETEKAKIGINDLAWNDYVLGLLSDDEKIDGNPTTDGLRRIFEIALNCVMIQSTSEVVQSPDPANEKRATVVHTLGYVLNSTNEGVSELNQCRTVSGSADVYWGNCDKIYRNHPVAVAETRAEGRALRRALKLRKVVAAEELASNIEDDPTGDSVSKISNNQINFIDVMAKRLNINPSELITNLGHDNKNVKNLMHEDAVSIIRELSKYQQDISGIPSSLLGYTEEWK